MRCLTLADQLRSRGWRTTFAHRPMPQGLSGIIEEGHHGTVDVSAADTMEGEIDLLQRALDGRPTIMITDHYQLDHRWQRPALRIVNHVAAIDDLALRPQAVSLLLNQNLGQRPGDYDGLVPSACRLLVGPLFALLRPQFLAARRTVDRGNRPNLQRVLVFISGADEPDMTLVAARGAVAAGMAVDIVIGAAYERIDRLSDWAARNPSVAIHRGVQDMANLMVAADLSVGAPSSATWERCCVGLPTILVVMADNQRTAGAALVRAGAGSSLGWHTGVSWMDVRDAILDLKSRPGARMEMAAEAAKIVDGLGTLRVSEAIEEMVSVRHPVELGGNRGSTS